MSVRRVVKAGAVAVLAFSAYLAAAPETAHAQDADEGARVFRRCAACHTTEAGGPNRAGPNLFGVIGATSAARDTGFNYSPALREAALEWNDDNLDQWLTAQPRGRCRRSARCRSGNPPAATCSP